MKERRLDLLTVTGGPAVIAVTDANGTHGFGMFSSRTEDELCCLDEWLDRRDAANELPDGRLREAA